jgi:hypothetical protein
MLEIQNRSQLNEDYEILPLVEKIVGCISNGSAILSIRRCGAFNGGGASLCLIPGWLVFRNLKEGGIAVNLEGISLGKTDLRRRLKVVQIAKSMIDCLGGPQTFPLRLTDSVDCPFEWRLYQASLSHGSMLCAISWPVPMIGSDSIHRERSLPGVTLTLVGFMEWSGLVSIGERRIFKSLRVASDQQRFLGELILSSGGQMSIQSIRGDSEQVDQSEQTVAEKGAALVRIDLGDIELSLQEIIALRAGTTLQLNADLPLHCYMRVGATTLAEGKLDIKGENFVLCIKAVMG